MTIDFEHRQSAHCENGVGANLLQFHGLPISEPMLFGIGSGLFFVYLPFVKVNAAPLISYRPQPGAIFSKAAKRLGVKIYRKKFRKPEEAQKALDERLTQGLPAGLQVGVYYLPYFPDEYRFHFNAHNLVVYGKENREYLISDPVLEYTTRLTEPALEKARYAKGPLAPSGQMYYPVALPNTYNLPKAIREGIKSTCKDMLAPVPLIGIKAERWLAKNIARWPEKLGSVKANHYLAHLIRMQEEIGTGGGGFRYIYAAFLQEASSVLNLPILKDLSEEMTQIGDQWRDFALNSSRIIKNRKSGKDLYSEVSQQLLAIADREEQFFKSLQRAIA